MGFHHGLSGLNASSKSLDVIGHNIANSNTVGFKSSRAEFNEMVASAMGASSNNNTGIGVSVAAVAQQFSQGVITPSSNGLDMAINGDGFFIVQTPSGTAYTRNGAFQLDKNGFLQSANGDMVMGYTIDPDTGVRSSTTLTNISFPTGAPIAAKQTSKVTAVMNLDARAEIAGPTHNRATYGTSVEVFDSLGAPHAVSIYAEKSDIGEWKLYDSLTGTTEIGTVKFDADGKLASMTPSPLKVTVNPTTGAHAPFDVQLDLSSITQYGTAFSVARLSQDGYASGELTAVNVAADGTLMASYSNGITRPEAQVALARFTNAQGLQPSGNNNWIKSNDSGPAIVGTADSGSFGTIQGSALEESNVDLTAQLVNMMTAQRAYQANAQTIKTQDQVFSTLVNLR